MKLLLDTNVVLDYFGVNEGFGEAAEEIFELAIVGEAIELVSASAITDIYYVARQRLKDNDAALSLIDNLQKYVHILPVTDVDVSKAIKRHWKDFEDSVQYTVAESNGVDYIISRNKDDFEENEIPCLTPSEFLDMYNDQ